MTKRRALAAIAALGAVVLLYPRVVAVAPQWVVLVRDEAGRPVPGVRVCQIWAHYDAEQFSHEDNRWTDAGGGVEFPPRTIRLSRGAQALAVIKKIAAFNVHLSYGRRASVSVHQRTPDGKEMHIPPAAG